MEKHCKVGTSHFLGQNLPRHLMFSLLISENKLEYVWATSWGVSTRLMGALIMTHSDDNGLVLPPHLAPDSGSNRLLIYKNDEQLKQIDAKVEGIVAKLKALGISVKYDNADNKRPGFKFADYELKGVPVRLVMGRDLENNTMEVMRRDTLKRNGLTCEGIETYVQNLLEEMQANIYKKALDHCNSKITTVDTYEEFKESTEEGGFIRLIGMEQPRLKKN